MKHHWSLPGLGLAALGVFLLVVAAAGPAGAAEPVPEPEGLPFGPVLTLRQALQKGLEANLNLKMEEVNIPYSQEGVLVQEAVFDPALDAYSFTSQNRDASPLFSAPGGVETLDASEAGAGLSKKFAATGLESRLGFLTRGVATNSTSVGLNPYYRNALVLDLTQPLLRDFGRTVNTTDLTISQNQFAQARLGFTDQMERTLLSIELAYYDLAAAEAVLKHRIESRAQAEELLRGNQEKFKSGVVPITEVQEAETAVAQRDELIVLARQLVETASNRLADLLEVRPGDALYGQVLRTQAVPQKWLQQQVPDREHSLSTALTNRSDLRLSKLEVENRQLRLDYQTNQTLPRLDLESSLAVNGLSGTARSDTYDDGPWSSPYDGDYGQSYNSLADGDGYGWYLGLRVTYPLGNRSARARENQAALEKRRAIYRVKRLEGAIITEIDNALVSIRRGLQRVAVAQRFEDLAQITLTQELKQLAEGLSDTFRILDFQDKLIEARIRKVAALTDYNKGLAALYRGMGTNLARFDIQMKTQEEKN
ncbi:MAG: TolC family protein [Deltaproteobacteria bacterium]|nr:TolC family protein [Deltaproteobacteria bacterium]